MELAGIKGGDHSRPRKGGKVKAKKCVEGKGNFRRSEIKLPVALDKNQNEGYQTKREGEEKKTEES